MSLDQVGFQEKEFARKNLWEASFLDFKTNTKLKWSTGLIKSITVPKLSFTIEDILGGTSKGYTGWKLPDNLSINIWETSDHMVEKYLDSWMGIGPDSNSNNGVFNMEKGCFRTQPNETYIYRPVMVETFIYEYSKSGTYQTKREHSTPGVSIQTKPEKKKNLLGILKLAIKEAVAKEQEGEVSLKQEKAIDKSTTKAVTEFLKIWEGTNQKVQFLNLTQVIPVVDKLTSLVSQLATQVTARVPFASSIVPPVIIPPPLLKIPFSTGTPMAKHPNFRTESHEFRPAIEQKKATPIVLGDFKKKEIETAVIDYISEKTKKENITTNFSTEYKAKEKITSRIIYDCAIEGYDIGTYDYSTGEGVSYNVKLAVRDMKIEYPNGYLN